MVWTGFIWLSCELSNAPSGSIKCWEILRVAEQLAASQEGLGSVELVNYQINIRQGPLIFPTTEKNKIYKMVSFRLKNVHPRSVDSSMVRYDPSLFTGFNFKFSLNLY
jgi:hypothetical protein